ncbi:MAG: 2-succinyl-5-enolpyruvyl-6-hydroxy-3-cyclohexene-1-carboxylic-acid synthase [Crocinitomicaceae bacterium]
MISSDKSSVQILLARCVAAGMKTIVCSPGSRNAPIVISADEHPDIETLVIHDERVAAFYALGISLATGEPVGLTCTSGSAMLNYYPAIAEAYYQSVPLIVMSADRPEEWVNHGDGQTIVQKGVYQNHIRGELVIPEDVSPESEYVERIQSLLTEAISDWKGPVHFNLPFSEPLYNTVDVTTDTVPLIESVKVDFDESKISNFKEDWKSAKRIMVLVGQMDKDPSVEKLLNDLAADPSICILVENTSNISGVRLNHCIDRSLNVIPEDQLDQFKPDLLLTFGGAVISKRIKAFLRGVENLKHYRVGFEFPDMDTYRHLVEHISVSASFFLKELQKEELRKYDSNFGSKWKQLDFLVKDHQDFYLDDVAFSDLKVFHWINQFLPDGINLHMANSSVVRYCQLFDPIRDARYYCNRGTSGIDGSTSTALGFAFKTPNKLNVLVTGDISFLYDSNALWSEYLTGNMKIIVVNNSGGGIFRIIDGPSSTSQLEKYFQAKHSQTAEHICKAFNIAYKSVSGDNELQAALSSFFSSSDGSRPELLEVFTDATLNDSVLKKYFEDAKTWM